MLPVMPSPSLILTSAVAEKDPFVANANLVNVPVWVARASVPGSGAVVDGLGGETFERVEVGT